MQYHGKDGSQSVKLGLAKGTWKLPEDFDDKFDSYDAEVGNEMIGGGL